MKRLVKELARVRLGLPAAVMAALLLLVVAVVGGCVDRAGAPAVEAAYESVVATETETPAAAGNPPFTASASTSPVIDETTPASEPFGPVRPRWRGYYDDRGRAYG